MKAYFKFVIPPETFHNQDQVKTHALGLIPKTIPEDLRIEVSPTGLTITYSVTFTSSTAATAAILKALQKELPA